VKPNELDTLRAAAPQLARALADIFNADASSNNGMFNGEAVLCRTFSRQAREALQSAGLIRPGDRYCDLPKVRA